MTVGPPLAQCLMWWASVQAGTQSQPGKAQPLSRAIRAVRCAAVTSLLSGVTSSGSTVSVEEDAGEHAVAGDHAGAADAQWSHPGHVADIEIVKVEIVKVEIVKVEIVKVEIEHTGIVVLGRDRC